MEDLVEFLERHGFVAAGEEAAELRAFAAGDEAVLRAALDRRLTGEPLAWIVGGVDFCGLRLQVAPGVYVPRWQTEELADALPDVAGARVVDLCTGCGALAAVARSRGASLVMATDVDPAAIACARANGVDGFVGDLFTPLTDLGLQGTIDLVCGVVPYVPTGELSLLQRDTFTFESKTPYDGGPDGCSILRGAITGAAQFLRPGGALVLELGGDEAETIAPDLTAAGFTATRVIRDEDGDTRGIAATLGTPARRG